MAALSLRVARRQEAYRARTFTLMADSCILRTPDEGSRRLALGSTRADFGSLLQ